MSKSTRPISERLIDHFRRLSGDILADYQDAIRSGSPDEVAAFREDFFREIIGRFFPRTHRTAKGPIFDASGQPPSRSIDCVVCAPNHPLLLDSAGRIVTLLADGVHGAIEVKPDLTDLPERFGEDRKSKPEIIRALEQVQSVKRLMRMAKPVQTSRLSEPELEYRRRVPTYVVSFEKIDITALAEYIAAYYREKRVPLQEQLDRLAVLDVGMLFVPKCPEQGLGEKAVGNILVFPSGKDSLAHLVLRFTNEPGPEMTMSAPLLPRYLDGHDWPKCSASYPTVAVG